MEEVKEFVSGLYNFWSLTGVEKYSVCGVLRKSFIGVLKNCSLGPVYWSLPSASSTVDLYCMFVQESNEHISV